MDNRQFPRLPLDSLAVVETDQHSGQSALLDLSPTGAKLSSPYPLNPRDYVSLNLSIPFREPSLRVALAAVRWVQGQTFGVEFIALPEHDKRRLREFLDNRSNAKTAP